MGRRVKTRRHNGNPQKAGVRPKERKYLDQVYEDMKAPEKANKLIGDADVPGRGRFYCIACSRYFITQATLDKHCESKPHKRREKQLRTEEVYLGSDLPVDNGMSKDKKSPFPESLAKPTTMEV
mmetsp:Transcript_12559/g.38072  ORF Transcript_12559/g.38072 Transcript_12559/m.38072 type:complete len:124 (-) Transcript_12559:63-434(-)